MLYSYVAKNGKTYYFHRVLARRGGHIHHFSLKAEGSIELPPGYTVVEGPTGLPIAKKMRTTGV